MKRRNNENKVLNNVVEEEEIPFAVDEELIQEPDYEEMPEEEIPFAMDTDASVDTDVSGDADASSVDDIDVPFSMKGNEEEENNMNEKNEKKGKKRRRKKKNKKALTIVLIILLVLGVCVGAGYLYVKHYLGSMGISDDNDIYSLMTKVDSSRVEAIE